VNDPLSTSPMNSNKEEARRNSVIETWSMKKPPSTHEHTHNKGVSAPISSMITRQAGRNCRPSHDPTTEEVVGREHGHQIRKKTSL
ncbi:hypothetical protein A2U01_0061517, partial [Trifolium medium]|nr:hypothetical protein [Trifolium medium]